MAKSTGAVNPAFVNKALGVRNSNPLENDAIGYSTRVLTQASLPHSDPGKQLDVWIRRNGNFCLSIQPHIFVDGQGNRVHVGYPYGVYPRLLLIYLCRQAVLAQRREVTLGSSLSSFMRLLGLEVTGGRWGTINRFKDQMRRLLYANISFTFTGQQGDNYYEAVSDRRIAQDVLLWWSEKKPDQDSLFDSYIVLSEPFFQEIIKHPVPLHMEAIATLRQSPLGLDLYMWLTHRVIWLKETQRITWKGLQEQVGSEYGDTRNFKKKVKAQLGRIMLMWTDLKLDQCPGGFTLKPSPPHVSPKLISLG